MTTTKRIKCDYCGAFVAYADLESGAAFHQMVTPDAEGTSETFETACKKCAFPNGKDKS